MEDELNLIEQIENKISDSELKIKRGDALERLKSNGDFKMLFLDYYLKTHAAELAIELGKQRESPYGIEATTARIIGVGQLQLFMQSTEAWANRSHQDIAECRQTIDEIESERGSVQ